MQEAAHAQISSFYDLPVDSLCKKTKILWKKVEIQSLIVALQIRLPFFGAELIIILINVAFVLPRNSIVATFTSALCSNLKIKRILRS